MKKFRFTLEPVATLRNLQEMRASEAFAAANRARADCDAALNHQQLRVAQFVEALIIRRTTGLPGAVQVSFMQAYRQELESEKTASEAVTKAAREQEVARKRWIDAHLQVRLVDKLRGRARERFQTELAHSEQRQLDDRQPRGGLFPES
jgi:flagellar export protein FliJ